MEASITTIPQQRSGAMAEIAQSREAQEVQAAVLMARRFPRDTTQSLTRILEDCKRPGLAEKAEYEYTRGGMKVTGPSIRLAESLARNWGNMQCGLVELERKPQQGNLPGESTVQAYAWDIETNTRTQKTFTVKHWRDTKGGGYALKDERDIYEQVANNGARRLRACILGIIPTDIVEQAIDQCHKTLQGGQGPIIDRVRAMVLYFKDSFNVSQEMIEKFLGHKVDAISENELVRLKRIANSLKDGMADRSEFFDVSVASPEVQTPVPPSAQPQSIKNFAPQTAEEAATWQSGDFNTEERPAAPAYPSATLKMPAPEGGEERQAVAKQIATERRRIGYDQAAMNSLIHQMFAKDSGQLTNDEMVKLLEVLKGTKF